MTGVKKLSALVFLLAALTTNGSVRLEAADCTGFMMSCNVYVGTWPTFTFYCNPGISCDEVRDCIVEACPYAPVECTVNPVVGYGANGIATCIS